MGRILQWLGFAGFALIALLLARHAGVLEFDTAAPDDVGTAATDTAATWQGPALPAVTLQTLNGERIALHDLRGRVMLINFWASWCPPCLEEFPLLFEQVKAFDGKLLLVAITGDSHIPDAVAFLQRFDDEYGELINGDDVIVAWDPGGEIMQTTFHVVRLPETFVVDQSGRLVRKVVGVEGWKGEELSVWLRELVGG